MTDFWESLEAANVVALIAAGVALMVGVLSPVINARTQRRTIEAQRRMANDERLWAKRAALYEEILRWAGTVRGRLAEVASEEVEDPDSSALHRFIEREVDVPLEIEVGLAAYATGEVNYHVHQFVASLRGWASTTREVIREPSQEAQSRMEFEGEYHRREADRMAQRLSDELAGVRPPKQSSFLDTPRFRWFLFRVNVKRFFSWRSRNRPD